MPFLIRRIGARFFALVSLRLQGHLVASAPVLSCLLEAQVSFDYFHCLQSLRDYLLSCALCMVFAVGLQSILGWACDISLQDWPSRALRSSLLGSYLRFRSWSTPSVASQDLLLSALHMFIAWILHGLRPLLACSDLGP